jgi:hypothetical protein
MEKYTDDEVDGDACTAEIMRLINQLVWLSKELRDEMEGWVAEAKARIVSEPRAFLDFLAQGQADELDGASNPTEAGPGGA